MNRYRVVVTKTVEWEIDVEAPTEQEAKSKATRECPTAGWTRGDWKAQAFPLPKLPEIRS